MPHRWTIYTKKKGFFCDQLPRELAVSSKDDILYVCGEFNCHLGRCMNSFDNVQGNQGLETWITKSFCILDLYTRLNLANNYIFRKEFKIMTNYKSNVSTTQLDYILAKRFLKLTRGVELMQNKECNTA